jgi:hypothetical protein
MFGGLRRPLRGLCGGVEFTRCHSAADRGKVGLLSESNPGLFADDPVGLHLPIALELLDPFGDQSVELALRVSDRVAVSS